VAQTFEISLQRLKNENPGALDLLNLIAFLAPDDIPRDLFGADAFELDKRIKGLRRYSLIQVRDGMISIHRLLQRIERGKLTEAEQDRYAGQAVELVDGAFPDSDDHKNWPRCAKLLPHALATTGFAEDRRAGLDTAATLMNSAGHYQWVLGRLPEALVLFERSLRLMGAIYGYDSPVVAVCENNLGMVLNDQGDLDGALRSARRALAIDEKVYGPDDSTVARDFNNIGGILRSHGDLDDALRYTQRALEIEEKIHGPDHPKVATFANNTGQILRQQGNFDWALRYTRRALAINEKIYGPDHPDTAMSVNGIGRILQAQGKLDDALPLFERALRIRTSVFGPDHPHTKAVANNLGLLQQQIAARDAAQ
jgi:tetratricopeptide (TPR) repeat protein